MKGKKGRGGRAGRGSAGSRSGGSGAKARAKTSRSGRHGAVLPVECFSVVRSGGRGEGFGVVAAVVEAVDGEWEVAQVVEDMTQGVGRGVASRKAAPRRLRSWASKRRVAKMSAIFAALGHPVRVGILVRLFAGPATYRQLQESTGLRAGPLYHHVNHLRLASLILPKRRDAYAMTRGGRNVLLVALALTKLAKDGRGRAAVGR